MRKYVKKICVALLAISIALFVVWIGIGFQRFRTLVIAHDCGESRNGYYLLQSPERDEVAVLQHFYCAGGFGTGSEWFTVKLRSILKNNADEEVFECFGNRAPGIRWINGNTLDINIQYICDITISLHQIDGINITYSISNELSQENFEKRIDKYAARTKEDIIRGASTFTGNKDKDFIVLKKVIEGDQETYRKFAEWAHANSARFEAH